MRGKIAVVLVLLSGIAVFVYGLYFTADISPADMRFDQRRDPLPADATAAQMFPVRLGDFLIEAEPQPVTAADANGGSVGYSARYVEIERNLVQIEAQQIDSAAAIPVLEARMEAFRRDQTVGRLTAHFDARVPFFYVSYAVNGVPTYAFYWVNGAWLFHATSTNTDEEAVLRFANVFPF
jgi:hypothetical protein